MAIKLERGGPKALPVRPLEAADREAMPPAGFDPRISAISAGKNSLVSPPCLYVVLPPEVTTAKEVVMKSVEAVEEHVAVEVAATTAAAPAGGGGTS